MQSDRLRGEAAARRSGGGPKVARTGIMWRRGEWWRLPGGAGNGPNKDECESGLRRVPPCAVPRYAICIIPSPSLRVFYFSSLSRPYDIDMADAASGSTERSVQVKLVLLGQYNLLPSRGGQQVHSPPFSHQHPSDVGLPSCVLATLRLEHCSVVPER